MRTLGMLLAVALLGGCPEYNLQGDSSIFGEPNPPDMSAPTKTDRIVQITVPAVDVLWVIDNSGSMGEEQDELTDSFEYFISYFLGSGLDWHVGVVSTDMEDGSHRGKLRSANGVNFLDAYTPDPIETFDAMARMGTGGAVYEKGRAAAFTALVTLGDGVNAGFARDDAHLAIIVISDEDDSSGNSPVSLGEFVSWMRSHKPREGMTSFSSIVGDVPGGCEGPPGPDGTPDTVAYSGDEYVAVTDAVGGIFWSICDPNWDAALDELGMQAVGLKREFFLSEVPVEETIEVRVVTDEVEETFDRGLDWAYSRERNSIKFHEYVPDELAEVFIEYQILAAWQPTEDDEESEE